MFLDIDLYYILLIICACCSILSFFYGMSCLHYSLQAVYVFFVIVFVVLSGLILFKIDPLHIVDSPSSADDYDTVTTAMLSYYIPQGSSESEDYFLEITEDNKYKFCYFEPNGSTITRAQIPAYEDGVEIIASNDDLPYRVEFCAKDDKIVAIKLRIPDDAHTIQFDADGK